MCLQRGWGIVGGIISWVDVITSSCSVIGTHLRSVSGSIVACGVRLSDWVVAVSVWGIGGAIGLAGLILLAFGCLLGSWGSVIGMNWQICLVSVSMSI